MNKPPKTTKILNEEADQLFFYVLKYKAKYNIFVVCCCCDDLYYIINSLKMFK